MPLDTDLPTTVQLGSPASRWATRSPSPPRRPRGADRRGPRARLGEGAPEHRWSRRRRMRPCTGSPPDSGALANKHIPLEKRTRLQKSRRAPTPRAPAHRGAGRWCGAHVSACQDPGLGTRASGWRPGDDARRAQRGHHPGGARVRLTGAARATWHRSPTARSAPMGEGRAVGPDGTERPVPELLAEARIQPVTLAEKEGLAP
ncbi:hypothetical protein QJS66_13795 [Kocuria rhizophila]|nr:hypothetical protein QJS66_13795 [Kocuria rhizophila]